MKATKQNRSLSLAPSADIMIDRQENCKSESEVSKCINFVCERERERERERTLWTCYFIRLN